MTTWRQRRRQEIQERAEAQAADRLGHLVGGFDDAQLGGPDDDQVGWMHRDAAELGSIKGRDHYCLPCSPVMPEAGMIQVRRNMLAATMPCSRCGRILEGIGR